MSHCDTGLLTFAIAAITGSVALIGVYLTNNANTERLNNELDYTSKENKRKLEISRAEELYELTDIWLKGLFSDYLNLTLVMQEKISFDQYHENITEYIKESKSNYTRLQMIQDIYFPKLKSSFEKITDLRSEMNDISSDFKKAYKKGDTDGKKYLNKFTDASSQIDALGEKFKVEIANCARNA